jgi:hypothetical protein
MKIALNMPSCLERALVEIIYLIELLMIKNPIDSIFGLKTSNSVIQRVNDILLEVTENYKDYEELIDQDSKIMI